MKKKLLGAFFILCLFFGIAYYISLPDYRVFNSMSFGSGNRRDTTLEVVIYKYWKIGDTIQEIEEEHNQINGTPTTLEINLYYSQHLIRYGAQPFKTVLFEYGEKNKQTALH